jgi:uncharacterized protein (TIGR03067 family)
MFSIMVCLAVSFGCSGDKAPPAEVEPEVEATQAENTHPDFQNLIGKWKIISSERHGEPNEKAVGNFFTFDETNLDAWIRSVGDIITPYELDPTVEPKHLTVKLGRPPNDRIFTAIYELDGDSLKICFKDRERPTGYKTTAENEWTSHVLQRTESYE